MSAPDEGPVPASVAVVAHARKSLGGGLPELRDTLAAAGVRQPLWFEIAKSKQAPQCMRTAIEQGADLVFVWGGDGTVQRCVDAAASCEADVALAIVPAGTANLLARNLDLPGDIAGAVQVGLSGDRRAIDIGSMNGEHFAVMAGAGLDALMIDDADAGLKDRVGRAAYAITGLRHLGEQPVTATVKVEGRRFYRGPVTCVLAGNASKVMGGFEVLPGSRPDDGLLDLGIATARSRTQWARTIGRAVIGRSEDSPFVQTVRGTSFKVRFDEPVPYELDGGARKPVDRLRIKVHPAAVTVCVPRADRDDGDAARS